MKQKDREKAYQSYLTDKSVSAFLEKCDSDLAESFRQGGCLHCSGVLHRADYKRKPRGGPEADTNDPAVVYRDSFCCDKEGCRKRHTPPSVRFLGRRVYWGIVVILVSAMRHGLKDEQVGALRESLGIDRRTLERWRTWWLGAFVNSPFWKMARARFMPSLCERTLPASLCEAFEIQRRDRLLDLLNYLSPLTTGSIPLETGFIKELIFPAEDAK